MLATALTGALIAISFSAPPGPVALETIRRGLRGGFGPALHVQLGSILGDVTWCLIALLGLAPLVQIEWLRGAFGVIGIAVLVYLGASGVRDAIRRPGGSRVQPAISTRGAFHSGMAISLANPMAVGYWLSVGASLVATGVVGATATQTASFVAGFLGGTLAWAFAMACAVRWGQRIMTPVMFRLVTFACSAALIGFGIVLASQMLTTPI